MFCPHRNRTRHIAVSTGMHQSRAPLDAIKRGKRAADAAVEILWGSTMI